jgi:hypothetical protein
MTKPTHELAADLDELRIIGAVDLPALSFTYAKLNQAIATTANHDSEAFLQPGGAGGLDQVHGAWAGLRSSVLNLLGTAANDLEAAGDTILSIMDAYATTDVEAARLVDKAWAGGLPTDRLLSGETPPGEQKPDVVLN